MKGFEHMLNSFALIILVGLLINWFCKKLRIPSLIGLLVGGILLGPSIFNLIDPVVLDLSADIRQIILIIILTQAGLSLDLKDLKKVGRPAILLSFVPATFEIITITIFAPIFLGTTLIESVLLGTVLAAVSPAIVVPRMVYLIQNKYGTKKGVPQLILAGSSIDDIYALIIFSSVLSIAEGESFNIFKLFEIPLAILGGLAIGLLFGYFLSRLFSIIKTNTITKVLILLSLSFVLLSVESYFESVPFSGILAVMSSALMLHRQIPRQAQQMAHIYDQLWIPAQIFLFVLVGASVNIQFAFGAGFIPVLVIALGLLVRTLGTWLSLLGTRLNNRERIFTLLAYTPKATVQAAIGGVPLAMGLPAGELILTVSVLAILITAPLGAFGIDLTYERLLKKLSSLSLNK